MVYMAYNRIILIKGGVIVKQSGMCCMCCPASMPTLRT